ncbi:hypothetical protein WUBG_14333 [Wuchereria bancrofti]|uniref:Uncharacterized protein n=1 Tax=Wuchereria bancrofti TaxID=6293 RepID=J9AKK5_WUCBA|nr:hypothetical protein WUBG_14333 [Wuchereria bancrofti]
MIDDRHMEASYRDIAREEKRSSRIGLIEDIREAHCDWVTDLFPVVVCVRAGYLKISVIEQ